MTWHDDRRTVYPDRFRCRCRTACAGKKRQHVCHTRPATLQNASSRDAKEAASRHRPRLALADARACVAQHTGRPRHRHARSRAHILKLVSASKLIFRTFSETWGFRCINVGSVGCGCVLCYRYGSLRMSDSHTHSGRHFRYFVYNKRLQKALFRASTSAI